MLIIVDNIKEIYLRSMLILTPNKIRIITFIVLLLATFSLIMSPVAASEGSKAAWAGLEKSADKGYGEIPQGSVQETIGKVIGSILAFVGIVFFLLIIYGGFTWMMARGNDQEVVKAKNLIESAATGLVIILAAYAITAFVGEQITQAG